MRFNISYPVTGQQKLIEIDDDLKIRHFYERRLGQEVEGEKLGEEFTGYIFRISGGNDREGFSMKQGVMVNGRVRLLMKEGMSCFRPRRAGHRKRKSVRGCIVGHDIRVLQLVVVKKGAQEIPGLTDQPRARRLGPKRASKIRKLFALDKETKKGATIEERDDVRRYVVRRKIEREGKATKFKAPRIQRLITVERIRRKKLYKAEKKARWEKAKVAAKNYEKLVDQVHAQRHAEAAKAAAAATQAK
jgi:small subunit ribosomal protein S6e